MSGIQFGVISNIGEWAAVLNEIINLSSQHKGSPYKDTNVEYQVNLGNFATTIAEGGIFYYYRVVDIGRGPVAAGSQKYLIYTTQAEEPQWSKAVKSAAGYEITARSLAEIQSTFSQRVLEVFRNWLDSADDNPDLFEDAANNPSGAVIPRLGHYSVTVSKYKKQPMQLGTGFRAETAEGGGWSTSAQDVEIPLLNEAPQLSAGQNRALNQVYTRTLQSTMRSIYEKAGLEFNPQTILEAAEEAAREFREEALEQAESLAQQAKEAAEKSFLNTREAASSVFSNLFKDMTGRFPDFAKQAGLTPGSAGAISSGAGIEAFNVAKSAFFRKVAKLNWQVAAWMFLNITKEQVEIFKANTPNRQMNGRFKLVSVGGGVQEIMPPDSGGQLQNGYVLVMNDQLESLVNDL